MSNPIYITPSFQIDAISTRERMAHYAQEAHADQVHSRQMLGGVIILCIVATACLLAWTLW